MTKLDHLRHAADHRERVTDVLEHAYRVLAKFPRETVPASMQWLLRRSDEIYTRLSKDGQTLKVILANPRSSATIRAELPAELLNAPEQDIHAWVRRTYWSVRNIERVLEQKRARENAWRNLAHLKAEATAAQNRYAAAQALADNS